MPFKKGQGGRKAGAHNKATGPVHDWFVELGGPNGEQYAKQLHTIAVTHNDVQVRLKALSIMAPYLWRKQVERLELTGSEGGPVRIVHEYRDA